MKTDFSAKGIYTYTLCGLHARSDVPLTAAPPSLRAGEGSDILIQIAAGHSPIPKNAGRVAFKHSVACSTIRIEDVADFEVNSGRHIRIWPAVGAAQKDVEIFLFGPVWATLCHQRGMLPLHASAIASKTGIIAFAGHPGAGKSTTAALMSSLGYELVADDLLPVTFNENSLPGAWPYLRRLKLHGDSIIQLGLTPTEVVSRRLDKKYFVSPKFAAHDKWSRLERLYLLEIDPMVSGVSIDRVAGLEAVRVLIDHTYHIHFIQSSGEFRDHLAFCTSLASKIAVFRLRRCPSVSAQSELRDAICAHLEITPTGPYRSETANAEQQPKT